MVEDECRSASFRGVFYSVDVGGDSCSLGVELRATNNKFLDFYQIVVSVVFFALG